MRVTMVGEASILTERAHLGGGRGEFVADGVVDGETATAPGIAILNPGHHELGGVAFGWVRDRMCVMRM
jgi:hypothetical protein